MKKNKKKKFSVPFSIEKSGEVTIEANSAAEAISIAENMSIHELETQGGRNGWCRDVFVNDAEEDVEEETDEIA